MVRLQFAAMADLVLRPARPEELARLRDIERAAGLAFADIGMGAVTDDEPPTTEELAHYQADGRCHVAVRGLSDEGDTPGTDGEVIAYIIFEIVDGCCHIEQVSVHPDHARQGVGARLLATAESWARARGITTMTLTTFVEVAWNGPYYQRCGYQYLSDEELTPGLRAVRAVEAELGLDRWPRSAMAKNLA